MLVSCEETGIMRNYLQKALSTFFDWIPQEYNKNSSHGKSSCVLCSSFKNKLLKKSVQE